MPAARLAVDIGGTFTDLALEHAGDRTTIKVLTTQAEPEKGVLDGVRTILATSGVKAEDIALIVHGTTLATNSIIERKGARTALLTTAGFRDVLELRRIRIPLSYDLGWEKPSPLVNRALKYLPLHDYSLWIAARDFSFFRHVAFDQLVTPQTRYISRQEVQGWLDRQPRIAPGSTYVIQRNGNSWKFGGQVAPCA